MTPHYLRQFISMKLTSISTATSTGTPHAVISFQSSPAANPFICNELATSNHLHMRCDAVMNPTTSTYALATPLAQCRFRLFIASFILCLCALLIFVGGMYFMCAHYYADSACMCVLCWHLWFFCLLRTCNAPPLLQRSACQRRACHIAAVA